MLTAERVREVLEYDPETGLFTYLVRVSKCIHVGDVAGSMNKSCGYRMIQIDGVRRTAHRLVWLWMTGEWPADEVDHINHDRTDNRWSNLRAASRVQNRVNTPRSRSNKSGLKGVSRHRRSGKWRSQVGGRHLGLFDCPIEAHAAYVAASVLMYGEFATAG